jgi:hypothetical protein
VQLGDDGPIAEAAAGKLDEARDLRARQAEANEPGYDGCQGPLDAGAEELRVAGDEGSDVGAGEAEACEEYEDGVGISGRLEVGELGRGLEGLRSGEAAGVDKVVVDGKSRAWGSGGGRGGREETVERGGGRREDTGEDAAREAEHGWRRRRRRRRRRWREESGDDRRRLFEQSSDAPP